MKPVRFFLVGSIVTILTCCAQYAQAETLSQAMARSLGVSAHVAVAKPKPAPKPAPTCGAWVDLHQGSGKGRTCEAGAL